MNTNKRAPVIITSVVVLTIALVAGAYINFYQKNRAQLKQRAEIRNLDVDEYSTAMTILQQAETKRSLSKKDLKKVEELSKSDEPKIRRYSINIVYHGLRESNPDAVIEYAKKFFDDEADIVRRSAYFTSCKVDPNVWSTIKEDVQNDPSELVRGLMEKFENEKEISQ